MEESDFISSPSRCRPYTPSPPPAELDPLTLPPPGLFLDKKRKVSPVFARPRIYAKDDCCSSLSSPLSSVSGRRSYGGNASSSSRPSPEFSSGDELSDLAARRLTRAIIEKNSACITEVWAGNLYQAFHHIRNLREQYPYIAMDTEFPGVVFCRHPGHSNNPTNHYIKYREIRANVDNMKLIQLGLTLMDANGNTPPGISTWQFNFKFSLTADIFAAESITLLMNAGLQFWRHELEGIEHDDFSYYFMASGLVLPKDIKINWITFHCGYDFAYLIRVLTGLLMPQDELTYIQLVKTYFPTVFDVKHLMLSCQNLYGGLQDVANRLGILRQGYQHQAGSDSLLTGRIFFRIKEIFFAHNIDEQIHNGCLFGFHTTFAGAVMKAAEPDIEAELAEITKFRCGPIFGHRFRLDGLSDEPKKHKHKSSKKAKRVPSLALSMAIAAPDSDSSDNETMV